MAYKFLITSAGLGTRLGPYSKHKNKALITLGTRPAISFIISKIPTNIQIVLALGYKGDILKTTINALHPNRDIKFVYVDKFEGCGSGLGYTMLQCESFLRCPFIYIPNDTIIEEEDFIFNPEEYGNWIGSYIKKSGDEVNPQQYRCIENNTNKILPKGIFSKSIYIGLCGIRDYKEFWISMKNDKAILDGESFGLNNLRINSVKNFSNWLDTGNLISLEKAEKKMVNPRYNILPKENEAIWINENIVLKYHDDKKFIHDRVKRLNFVDKNLFPSVSMLCENIYSYKKVEGEVFSKKINSKKVKVLLDLMQNNVWNKVSKKTNSYYEKIIKSFYKDKTIERVKTYEIRFEVKDKNRIINGVDCNPILKNIQKIDWNKILSEVKMANFHGDFHNENIIYNEKNNKFTLIDWRQNFGNEEYEFGDVYYDLAKFLHGLIVSHKQVIENHFTVEDLTEEKSIIDINQSLILNDSRLYFYEWLKIKNYNIQFIEFLTALIFVNISPLHHYPYSKFLYYLGQLMLEKNIANWKK